jgi:L-serine dehydratase
LKGNSDIHRHFENYGKGDLSINHSFNTQRERKLIMNIYDILGPIMVGPSSSHTAGAVKIGLIAVKLLGIEPKKAEIYLHGSFAATGEGHGTNKAIVAGLLGMQPDDMLISKSFEIAEKKKLQFKIGQINLKDAHPNTVLLKLTGEDDRQLEIQASSLGGGRIMVNKLDGIDVNFTGESHTLIVHNIDQPGHVAEVTSTLSHKSVNIATMQLYRDKRGGYAVMVIETDQEIPKESVAWLSHLEGIIKVSYLNIKGE